MFYAEQYWYFVQLLFASSWWTNSCCSCSLSDRDSKTVPAFSLTALYNLLWNELPQKPSLLPHTLYFFNLMFLISLLSSFLNGFFNHASSIHIPSWFVQCLHNTHTTLQPAHLLNPKPEQQSSSR